MSRASSSGPVWTPRKPVFWLGGIVVVALVARLAGVGFGLPEILHPDEPEIAQLALDMLDRGDPHPHRFVYPTLYPYVQLGVLGTIRALVLAALPELAGDTLTAILYASGRTVTALLGTVTVIVTYLAARRFWTETAGLVAAAFLALCFLHVEQSQYIKPDVPSGLFAAVSLWLTARGMTGAGDRSLVAAGAAAGFAAARKYNAGLCLLVPLTAWAVRASPGGRQLHAPALIVGAAVLAFCAAMPWAVLAPREVWQGVSMVATGYRQGTYIAEGDQNWRFYLAYLVRDGLTPGLAALALCGWLLLAAEPRHWLPLSVFPLLAYALLSGARVRATRNLVPLLPHISLMAGFDASTVLARAAARGWPVWTRRSVLAAVLLADVAGPVTRIALRDYYLMRPDTRTTAARWIEANLPSGATICRELFTPSPSTEWFTVISTLLLPAKPLDWYRAGPCEYVLTSSFLYAPALHDPDRYPGFAAFYGEVLGDWRLLAEFRHTRSALVTALLGEHFDIANPIVRVHRVPGRSDPAVRP